MTHMSMLSCSKGQHTGTSSGMCYRFRCAEGTYLLKLPSPIKTAAPLSTPMASTSANFLPRQSAEKVGALETAEVSSGAARAMRSPRIHHPRQIDRLLSSRLFWVPIAVSPEGDEGHG
jgi:hypothetical protein